MVDPATIPRIDGDMAALAGHADAIASAGAGFAETGSAVHSTWQGLAPFYVAPEASELLAATAPIVNATASIDEDLQAAAAALRAYATEVAEIQTRFDALRVRAVDLMAAAGAEPADPALADQEGELAASVAAETLAWDAAQRRCAAAIRAVTGSGAEVGLGQVVPAHFAPSAPIAADTPLPVKGPSTPALNWFDELADNAQDAVVVAANGLASLGNAVIHNPAETAALIGGVALAGISSAGVVAGVGATATGAGAVVGVPLGGVSALGVATGVALAGAAGASIVRDAMGDDSVEPVRVGEDSASAEAGDAPDPGDAGSELRGLDDVMANPQILKGRSPEDVEAAIGGTPGWQVEGLGKGRGKGTGWMMRRYTERGEPTGEQVRWHPGGGHHGREPYWRVIGPNGDLGGIIR